MAREPTIPVAGFTFASRDSPTSSQHRGGRVDPLDANYRQGGRSRSFAQAEARIVPLAATVRPGSALLRSIAGKAVRPPAPQLRSAALAQEEAALARLATGRGAAAVSASYGRSRRQGAAVSGR